MDPNQQNPNDQQFNGAQPPGPLPQTPVGAQAPAPAPQPLAPPPQGQLEQPLAPQPGYPAQAQSGTPQQPAPPQPYGTPQPPQPYGQPGQQQPFSGYTPLPQKSSSKKLFAIIGGVVGSIGVLGIGGIVAIGLLVGSLADDARFTKLATQTETVGGVQISIEVPGKYKKVPNTDGSNESVTWGITSGSNNEEFAAQEFVLASKDQPATKEEIDSIKAAMEGDAATRNAVESAITGAFEGAIADQKVCTDVKAEKPTVTTLSGSDLAFELTFTCKAIAVIDGLGTEFAGKIIFGYAADKHLIGAGVVLPKTVYDKDTQNIDRAFKSFNVQ